MVDQWAYDRVRELVDAQTKEGWHDLHMPSGAAHAFARYIAEHEEAPVDPVIAAAREMFIEDRPSIAFEGMHYKHGAGDRLIRAGNFDNHFQVLRYIQVLRRGMELARTPEQPS